MKLSQECGKTLRQETFGHCVQTSQSMCRYPNENSYLEVEEGEDIVGRCNSGVFSVIGEGQVPGLDGKQMRCNLRTLCVSNVSWTR